jgi:hypothetical protein
MARSNRVNWCLWPVLAVAAGKSVYFWGGLQVMNELKRTKFKYSVPSVGLDVKGRKFVVGEEPGTWARVYRWDDDEEIGMPGLFHLFNLPCLILLSPVVATSLLTST